MTHCRLSAVKCSAFCADGSAMFTMVASRTTISWATPRRASTAHRLGRGIKWVSGLVVLITVLWSRSDIDPSTNHPCCVYQLQSGNYFRCKHDAEFSAIMAGVMNCQNSPSAMILLPRLTKQVMRRAHPDELGMDLRLLMALSFVGDHDGEPQQELVDALCMDAKNV